MKNSLEVLSDPLGVGSSVARINEAWMQNSAELLRMFTELYSSLGCTVAEEIKRIVAENEQAKEDATDLRTFLLKQVRSGSKLAHKYHITYGNWLRNYVSQAPGVDEREKERVGFWTNQLINALVPSNCFWTNPGAVNKFLDSGGESLKNGFKNWLEDVNRGDNLVRIADYDAFKVGVNLAITPGRVIFRNELMELIQYTPTTENTYTIPIVFVPPWINKYYILDLTQEKSLVRYLVDQGFTVFLMSWKNPTAEMRDVSYEDYMLKGALKAVEVAKEICGVEQVHAVGYCIGGTVLATLMAWLNRPSDQEGQLPIAHWTLFATMVDYSNPGELSVYINDESIRAIYELVEREGYLDGKYMGLAFRLLRSDSFIWRYYVHNYLQGGVPPKSDFLFWNGDLTRLTAALCKFYLKEFYLENKLIREDEVTLAGRPIDLRRIHQPLYAVGAEQDHICPWKETFRIANLVKGAVRYVLSTEGHITGIVNPPSENSRRKHWAGETTEQSEASAWLSGQQEQQGSWWVDWTRWLSERCDSMRPHPPMGSEKYPPLEKAPGHYVVED
jgi:polyhydroxyalkanoate synthase